MWVPFCQADPNSSKPKNKVPKVNSCFFLSKNIVPPSFKPCCQASAESPKGVHKRAGSGSGQSVKLIQNETTNLKTSLFRLDKEKQKKKFHPVPLSFPCLPVQHSSPLSHSSQNKLFTGRGMLSPLCMNVHGICMGFLQSEANPKKPSSQQTTHMYEKSKHSIPPLLS
jgi:hypothetical protein